MWKCGQVATSRAFCNFFEQNRQKTVQKRGKFVAMSLIVCVDNFVVFSGQDVETLWICFCKGAWQRSKRRGVSFFRKAFLQTCNPKMRRAKYKKQPTCNKTDQLAAKKNFDVRAISKVTVFFATSPKKRQKFCEKNFLLRAVLLFCLRWKGGKTFSLRRAHFFAKAKGFRPACRLFPTTLYHVSTQIAILCRKIIKY